MQRESKLEVKIAVLKYTSFDGWARSAKGGGSSVGDGRRPEIATDAGNGGDLRRNGGNGSAEMGEC
jgi:hypothetical protein